MQRPRMETWGHPETKSLLLVVVAETAAAAVATVGAPVHAVDLVGIVETGIAV